MSRRLFRALILLFAALPGCDTRALEETTTARAGVLNGEPSPAGPEDGVLALRTEVDGAELVCSATLVAPNLVLTARHCVSHLVPGRFSCSVKGELASADPGAGTLGTHLPADQMEFFGLAPPRDEPLARGEFVLSTLSETICLNDVAFVLLDRELSLPPLPLRVSGRARRGEPATIVGYGLDEDMVQQGRLDLRTQVRLRNDELTIEEVGPPSSDDLVTVVPPRTLLVTGPSGCFGDSGGPLLARDSNAVLGVYSLMAGADCTAKTARHLFVHFPDFQALTRDAFELAGHEPIAEADPSSAGAGGEGGADAGAAGAGGAAGTEHAAAGEGGGNPEGGAAGAPVASGEGGEGGEGEEPAVPVVPPARRHDGGCSVPSAPAKRGGSELLLGLGLLALLGKRRASTTAPMCTPDDGGKRPAGGTSAGPRADLRRPAA